MMVSEKKKVWMSFSCWIRLLFWANLNQVPRYLLPTIIRELSLVMCEPQVFGLWADSSLTFSEISGLGRVRVVKNLLRMGSWASIYVLIGSYRSFYHRCASLRFSVFKQFRVEQNFLCMVGQTQAWAWYMECRHDLPTYVSFLVHSYHHIK